MVHNKEIVQLVDELSKKNPNLNKVHKMCLNLGIKTSFVLEEQMQIVLKALDKLKKSDFKQFDIN